MVTFVTGSKRRDLPIFLLLACLVIAASYRLRVYFQVTVLKVSVVQITPDGTRRVLSTPGEFRRIWSPDEPSTVIPKLERNIMAYMRNLLPTLKAEPETRFEWVILYSHNSRRLDQRRLIVFDYERF